MLKQKKFKAHGFTIIEVLIALAIGMILLLGLTSFLIANLQGNKSALQQINLDAELRNIANLAARDLRRAGYYAGPAVVNITGVATPPSVNVNRNNFARIYRPAESCVLYSYNRDSNTNTLSTSASPTPPPESRMVDIIDAGDNTGIKLVNGMLSTRTACNGGTCSNTDCTADTWVALHDTSKVKITALHFCYYTSGNILNGTTCREAWPAAGTPVKQIGIVLTGQLANPGSGNPAATQSVQSIVKLENSPDAQ